MAGNAHDGSRPGCCAVGCCCARSPPTNTVTAKKAKRVFLINRSSENQPEANLRRAILPDRRRQIRPTALDCVDREIRSIEDVEDFSDRVDRYASLKGNALLNA